MKSTKAKALIGALRNANNLGKAEAIWDHLDASAQDCMRKHNVAIRHAWPNFLMAVLPLFVSVSNDSGQKKESKTDAAAHWFNPAMRLQVLRAAFWHSESYDDCSGKLGKQCIYTRLHLFHALEVQPKPSG